MMELFKEFAPHSAQQWKEQIIKDLKGSDIKSLDWNTENGFTVHPFYTSEDLKDEPKPLFGKNNWDACFSIEVKDAAKANQLALMALNQGASGLVFRIQKAVDSKILLKGIELDNIYSQFDISNDALALLKDLEPFLGKTNKYDGKLKTFVNIDPLSLLAYYGEWHEDEKKDLAVMDQLDHIPANFSIYLEAGASTVNELAIGLSHLNEYLNALSEKGKAAKKIIHISISVKGDFFGEIAKLRALRKLVNLLQEQYSLNLPLHIHSQTASINKSSLDAYNNMIRSTTECMSALIGGSESISVLPYNNGFGDADEFSARMAINQQHICRDEAYIGKVADIATGSYYLEILTEELGKSAWEKFKEIEKLGGYIAAFKSGYIQNLIEKDAAELQKDTDEAKRILIGVNKFQNPKKEFKEYNYLTKPHQETASPFKKIRPFRPAFKFEEEKLTKKSTS